jgi:peptidoglycan/xylan/chitin deacetylase (PgdA/CDA1 family)
MSRKLRLTDALDHLALRARRLARLPWVTVISYHRIGEVEDDCFDPGVIDASAEEFDRQMAVMARDFNVIGIDQLIAALAGGPLPRNAALITFDDGYRAVLDLALPILRKHGLTACFFIPTVFITDRRLFWWDRLARAIRLADGDTLRLGYPEQLELPLGDRRDETLRRVQRVVKRRPNLDVDRFVEQIEAATDLTLTRDDERILADMMILDWDGVRAMAAAGMDIGSHTRTHRVLQTLPPEALDQELRGSRLELERELGRPVRALAYPVGYPIVDRPDLLAAVERAGYQVAFSNATGLITSRRPHRLDLSRLAAERGTPDSVFRATAALPLSR